MPTLCLPPLSTAVLLAVSGSSAAGTTRGEDIAWLNRITYGTDGAALAEVERHGRSAYLKRELHPSADVLPQDIQAQINALDIATLDPKATLAAITAENKRIGTLTDGGEKEQARKALNDQGNKFAYQAARRHLLRAVYSRDQLQEQLVWFWLNHFSVYQYKGNVRWLIGDYEEHAIRPHVLGHFRDLVLATLTHPAMLQYLDNAQNSNGHLNENYARELMELHTLSVDAGYTQTDVQELARTLTGAGLNAGEAPKLKREWQPLYRSAGAFEFNPARHDFGAKTLLGHPIEGSGFDEIEHAVDLLTSQPACARFVSRRLAQYFVADEPPPKLVERMAQTFLHSQGDIARVLDTMFSSREFSSSLGKKFRDPMHYLICAVRVAYEGRTIVNTRPLVNSLNALGEPLYGHVSPDGYSLAEAGWASSGQMSRRFEIARSIAAGNAGLFAPEDGSPSTATGFPQLANRLYFERTEALLGPATRTALERASSQVEWNTLLLASPEFNYR